MKPFVASYDLIIKVYNLACYFKIHYLKMTQNLLKLMAYLLKCKF